MNLSPEFVPVLQRAGFSAVHWNQIGATAPDRELLKWAREHDHVVLTHDLDYGAILFGTGAVGPSVIQLRIEDVRPATIGALLVQSLRVAHADILAGALVTIDPRKARISLLPLRK